MINTKKDCRGDALGNNYGEKKIEQEKEAFVAALTHDLKTPTIAQIRMLEILLDGTFGELNDAQKEAVEQILKSAKYMLQMISRVLYIYKFENGKTTLEYQTFDFSKLVKECTDELVSLAKDKGLRLNIKNLPGKEETGGENFISADKTQIRRVIINLVSNAIFYAYKNTEIKIVIQKADENRRGIVFTVENSSPYIPKDILDTLFDKYVSNSKDTFPKGGGTGLGLYITERIISAHGGRIIAKSSEGNINMFGFEIPA